ncbi:MAG: acriflavin resistance protein [Candidatus Angelobacter sp.]|nr:acriflavin resistance protein [Candidatus Angelobacter sp.]
MAAPKNYWFSVYAKPVIFLILVLAVVGAYLAFSIPVAVFPETNFPRVVIGVDNGVMPIEQMQVTVTRPIEEAMNSIPGLQSVRSITSRGSAEIDLFFTWRADMVQTLQFVDAALSRAQATLPPTAKIETHRLTFASFPILGYSLTSDSIPQTKLWEIATYEIKPRLNRLTGVASIVVQGGKEPEYHITPNPAKLQIASITVPDLLAAVARSNTIDSPGLFQQNHQLVLGLVSGQVHSPEELAQITVKTTAAGVPVRIGDVASVGEGVKPVYTIVTANGKPAVLININRQPDGNTVQVADEVAAEIANIKGTLPPGVQLIPYYDQSGLVRDSINSVRDAIILGLILASAVLVLFLRDWGSSLVAGLVIPITICITFICLKVLGESFNLMTLGGLAAAVGLVIDDAIVVVENIVLHRDSGQDRFEAIRSALAEITVPLVGSTVTPIVVFLPLITMEGVIGAFFRALAITMSVALVTSLVLALTWTPNLSLFFIRRKSDKAEQAYTEDNHLERLLAAEEATLSGRFGKVVKFYERLLKWSLERPKWIALGCALLVVLSFFCYQALGTDLLPSMDEGGFIVDYLMPAGSSLAETNRVVSHVEEIIRSAPEVESMSRRTGLQLGLAAVTEANRGDIAVKLKADHKRDTEEVTSDLRAQIQEAEPALKVEFVEVLADMIGDLSNAPEPIRINLFAQNPDELAKWAPQIAEAIGKVPGVVDVLNGIEDTVSGPAVAFQVNPAVAARSGFTPEEIAVDSAALVEGAPSSTQMIVGGKPYSIRVRVAGADKMNSDQLSNMLLVSSTGKTATLGSLASVVNVPGQTEIRRENLQRVVSVIARLEGVDLGTGVAKVQKVVSDLHVPPSIRLEYGGTYQEQQKSFRELGTVLALAVIFIFGVLLFEFRSFAAPTAIIASAVLSTSGVLLALLITRVTFNVASFMGLIMVVGIVAKNGILLLDAETKFRAFGMNPEEAMIQAGRRRLRPIAMTALATIAGMLPLSFAIGAGSQMLQPLAIAVIGGILISMALSLLVTPAVHFYLNRSDAKGESISASIGS